MWIIDIFLTYLVKRKIVNIGYSMIQQISFKNQRLTWDFIVHLIIYPQFVPIVNFPFLDGDDPLASSYSIYISRFVRFTCTCNIVSDFKNPNLVMTEKLLHQGYRFHKLYKTFTKFYYSFTCRDMIKEGISLITNKSKKLKSDTSKLVKSLKNLIVESSVQTYIWFSLIWCKSLALSA